MASGLASAPLAPIRGFGAAVGALDRIRSVTLLAAAGLFASLFAPWYDETVTARGLAGPRHVTASLSGWTALSSVAVACALLSLVVWAWVLGRAGTAVTGLGADARRASRTRTDGLLVALVGLTATVWLLVKLADHPGARDAALGTSVAVSIRWGFVLTLVLSLALVGCGALVARRARRADPVREARRPRAARARRPRAARARRARAARARRPRPWAPPPRAPRPSRAPQATTAAEPPMPDFDFAVSDEPVPVSAPRPTAGDADRRRSDGEPGRFSRSAR